MPPMCGSGAMPSSEKTSTVQKTQGALDPRLNFEQESMEFEVNNQHRHKKNINAVQVNYFRINENLDDNMNDTDTNANARGTNFTERYAQDGGATDAIDLDTQSTKRNNWFYKTKELLD